MTNEEILQNHAPGWLLKLPSEATQDFKEAMDEARKDEAVGFQKFVSGFFIKHGNDRYINTLDSIYMNNPNEYTIEQLYEQFK